MPSAHGVADDQPSHVRDPVKFRHRSFLSLREVLRFAVGLIRALEAVQTYTKGVRSVGVRSCVHVGT